LSKTIRTAPAVIRTTVAANRTTVNIYGAYPATGDAIRRKEDTRPAPAFRRRSRSSRRTGPSKRSAITFARGARRACLDDLDVGGGEHPVEGSGECAVAVAEPEASVGVVEVHVQVAGLLGQPGSISRRLRSGLHLHRRKHGDNVLNALPDAITGNRWKSPLAC